MCGSGGRDGGMQGRTACGAAQKCARDASVRESYSLSRLERVRSRVHLSVEGSFWVIWRPHTEIF
eukprot:4109137-Prymnesium_polylepis.1